MWWFLKHKIQPASVTSAKEAKATAINHKAVQENRLLEVVPDLSERLSGADIAIKIWLPEMVAATVKWMAEYNGVSQSVWLRELLVTYLYGRVAVLAQQIRDARVEKVEAQFSRPRVDRSKGRWVYLVPQLGKNTVAFKLWVSQQMRDDLQVLSEHAKVGLSPFVREAIIAEMLGRGSLPERPEIMGAANAAALLWEQGQDVPVAEVAEEKFSGMGSYEQVWREDRN